MHEKEEGEEKAEMAEISEKEENGGRGIADKEMKESIISDE